MNKKFKKLIGYTLKLTYNNTTVLNAVLSILNLTSLPFIDGIQIQEGSKQERELEEAGVLNLWFDKVYKDTYNTGDYIITLKIGGNVVEHWRYVKSYYKVGEVLQLEHVSTHKGQLVGYTKEGHVIYLDAPENPYYVRLATKEEVEKRTIVIKMVSGGGPWELIVNSNGVYYEPEDVYLDLVQLRAIVKKAEDHVNNPIMLKTLNVDGTKANTKYVFSFKYIDCGCKPGVPIADWVKVIKAVDSFNI